MVSNGLRWSQMVSDVLRCSQVVSGGLIWCQNFLDGLSWLILITVEQSKTSKPTSGWMGLDWDWMVSGWPEVESTLRC